MSKTLHFKSRKDNFFTIVILGTIGILLITTISFWLDSNSTLFAVLNTVICGAISALLLWMFYGTGYTLSSHSLHYFSGPIKGSIKIDDIKTLEIGQTKYVGLKIATARKGIVVHYNKYDEIYISPSDNDIFAKALAISNPNIIIKEI